MTMRHVPVSQSCQQLARPAHIHYSLSNSIPGIPRHNNAFWLCDISTPAIDSWAIRVDIMLRDTCYLQSKNKPLENTP